MVVCAAVPETTLRSQKAIVMVSWSRVTALYVQGFNIRVSTQAALSEAQKKLYRIFCLPRNDEMEVEVITRARRDLLDYWRHMKAMSNPRGG